MRIFVLAAFVLFVSFGAPFFANADTNCTTTVDGQIVAGLLVNGVCSVSAAQISGGNPSAPTQTSGGNPTGTGITLLNPLKSGTSLSGFLTSILDFVITIGSIIVILMLVYVGFKFVTAQGKPGEIDAAKQMLLWTIIGALILLGSKAIALGVEATVRALGG